MFAQLIIIVMVSHFFGEKYDIILHTIYHFLWWQWVHKKVIYSPKIKRKILSLVLFYELSQ